MRIADQIRKDAIPHKLTAQQAGYMAFPGAIQDGTCEIVNVPGGVSKAEGCCNAFLPAGPHVFSCGTCKFISK